MHSFAMRRQAGCELRRSFILIAAAIVAFALLWYASLRTAAVTRGAVNVVARAAFLILTCVGCIAIGFFLPMVPVISAVIGNAFWAGLLATVGALAGMGLSDDLLNRVETRESGVTPTAAHEKTRPPV
ncbi:MAG TPA: hypothetical protein VIZ19_01615 [Roseiarcus sp.]|jgi:uncharacterized membrane protein YoaK (UPF0700 family)